MLFKNTALYIFDDDAFTKLKVGFFVSLNFTGHQHSSLQLAGRLPLNRECLINLTWLLLSVPFELGTQVGSCRGAWELLSSVSSLGKNCCLLIYFDFRSIHILGHICFIYIYE